MLSSTSKNQEIQEFLASNAAFNSGKVVVASIEDTANEDYKRIMFVQQRQSNNVNSITAAALGWDKRIERTWQNFKTDRIPSKLVVSANAEEGLEQLLSKKVNAKIRVIHSLVPAKTDTWTQPAMQNRDGIIMTFEGKPVYRNTELVEDHVSDIEFKLDPVGVNINELTPEAVMNP
jgi:hypothetical protein